MAAIPVTRAYLRLSSRIWDPQYRRSILNRALTECAEFLEDELRANIDRSTPAGRVYKVGRVTTRRTSATKHLRRARGTKTRVYVSAVFHTASAREQPPAKLTGALYRSLKARRNPGKLEIIASANADAVAILDDPDALSRPFFRRPIETYYKFVMPLQIDKAIKLLLAGGSRIRVNINQ